MTGTKVEDRPPGRGRIRTASGVVFDLLDPRPEMVVAEDVAHALACTCRFGGHASSHYSVAQHSIHVAEVVHRLRGDLELEALLHDATEAYVGDLVRPLKELLPAYCEIESRVHAAICDRFGASPLVDDVIHDVDALVLRTEARDLCWGGAEPPEGWYCSAWSLDELRIEAWDWRRARTNFEHELHRLRRR